MSEHINLSNKELAGIAKGLYRDGPKGKKLKRLKPGNTRITKTIVEKYGYEYEVDRETLFLNMPGNELNNKNSSGYVYRDFISYIEMESNYVQFRFKSTDTDSRPRKSVLKKVGVKAEDHLAHLDKIALSLAVETGREYIVVESGRTDKNLLESKGYQHEGNYRFIKEIDRLSFLDNFMVSKEDKTSKGELLMNKGTFIAVEGVIGIGKTTLTNAIAEEFKFETMFEIVEENPFLEKFYNDPDHWAFQTEVFFLANRYKQLKDVMEAIHSGKNLVSDYHIAKNLIFASQTLTKEENKKYKNLFNVFIDGFEHPDIIIYSKGSLEEIMRRIKKRGRIIEKGIDPEYIQKLIHKYDEVMQLENLTKRYPGVQLIEIDADKIDFIKHPECFYRLFDAITMAMEDKTLNHQLIG